MLGTEYRIPTTGYASPRPCSIRSARRPIGQRHPSGPRSNGVHSRAVGDAPSPYSPEESARRGQAIYDRAHQEAGSTPTADLMARENQIVTVPSTWLRPGVPKANVDADLDWRLPTFEAGKYLLAFDGACLRRFSRQAALLLLELWRCSRERVGLP